jgi:galactose mutarotase-like enzyme
MVTLENKYLKATISSQGAELVSLYNKKNNTEYIWQADPSIWEWHAPNLFPVVGECLNGEILVDGKAYPMVRHGFTRHTKLKWIESSESHAKFSLNYNQDTLAVYPYKFELQVLYDLFDDYIRVSYKVINKDDNTIYFSIGGHPGFNIPFREGESYDDYYLEFESDTQLNKHVISAGGRFTGQTEPVQMDGNKMHLNGELFKNDALVFKRLKSRKINIRSKNHNEYISVSYPHMEFMGIWAKVGAPYVCIEPWMGCADTEGKPVDIKDKEGIEKLEHGHVFETDFTIGIYND